MSDNLADLLGVDMGDTEKSRRIDQTDDFVRTFHQYIRQDGPSKKYSKYFSKMSDDQIARFMRDLKNSYGIMVIKGDWDDVVFVQMVDHLVAQRREVNQYTLKNAWSESKKAESFSQKRKTAPERATRKPRRRRVKV